MNYVRSKEEILSKLTATRKAKVAKLPRVKENFLQEIKLSARILQTTLLATC